MISRRGRLSLTDSLVTEAGPYTTTKPRLIAEPGLLDKKWRPPTLPHCIAVPSAQAGLTSLFEMGRGGTPPQ